MLIEFKDFYENDKKIYLEPGAVVAVKECRDNGCLVSLGNSPGGWMVVGTIDEVMKKLGNNLIFDFGARKVEAKTPPAGPPSHESTFECGLCPK